MAENIKIGIDVDDGGSTKKLIKSANELKGAYEGAATAANMASKMAGVKAASAPKTTAAISGASQSSSDLLEYNRAKGIGAQTGAAGRDFANQAQGLGGLVRLYATFAANIFAVSAAYRALSSAADTTNLVKGLDLLGATSGKSLGTLSKRLVEVTDGAISMRDAMASVAQTSSAGMSSKNIERLAGVAKNASLALGISMPDALSRLSRGITKLEPELLDELGLFTKIGPATEKYALSIGKTAAQLTDFERRQAFANAVLEEGETKFSALAKAAANPYDKLIASLSNVLQSGLAVVNTVLAPIVDFLSKTPTALIAGLTAIATILVKQAIPALGEFRDNLQRNAALAGQAALGKVGEAKAAREQLNRVIEAKVEQSADAQLKTFEELEAKMYASASSGTARRSALWKTLKKDIVDIGEADLAQSERSVRALEKRAKKDPGLQNQAQLERATLDQLKAVIGAEDQLTKVRLANRQVIEDSLKMGGQYARIEKAATDYEISAKKQAIVSNAAYNASLLGMRNSWILVKEEIAASGLQLGLFGKGLLYVRAGMATLVGIVGTLGSAINRAFMVITTIIAVFSALDAVFSKNSKEASNFSSSLDAANESVANVSRTLAAATSKEGFGTATIQNTVALSNAFNELTDSAKKAISAADEANKAASGWDKFWDKVFSIVGKDRESKLAVTIAKQIGAGFDLLAREGLDEEYAQKLTKLLGVENLKDTEEVANKFKQLSKDQREAVGSIINDSNRLLGNLSSTLQGFKDKSDQATKSYKEYLLSLADNNPLFKLGRDFLELGISMQKVAEGGINQIAKAFEELVKNPEKVALFGDEFVKEFIRIKDAFESQKQAIDANATALAAYKQQLLSINAVEKAASTSTQGASDRTRQNADALVNRPLVARFDTAGATAQENIRLLQIAGQKLTTTAVEAGADLFKKASKAATEEAMRLINKGVAEARASAGIMIERALTSNLTGSAKAASEGRLRDKEIQIQIDAVNTAEALYNKQGELVDQTKIANALQVENNALLRLSLAGEKDKPAAQKAVEKASEGVRIARGDYTGIENGEQMKANAEALKSLGAKQFEAQRARLGGQLTSSKISTGIGVTAGTLQEERELEALAQRRRAATLSQYDVLTSIAGVTSAEVITQKQLLEQADLEKRQKQEIKDITDKIAEAENLRAQAEKNKKPEAVAEQTKQIDTLTKQKSGVEQAQAQESLLATAKTRQALLNEEIDKIGKRYEVTRSNAELEKTIALDKLEYQSQELSLYSSAYNLSKEFTINEQASLDRKKAILESDAAIAAAQSGYNQKREEAEARIKTLREAGGPKAVADIAAVTKELERQKTLTDNTVTGLQQQVKSKTDLIDKTKQVNLEQERYNQLIKDSGSLAESLKAVFGDVGEKIGSVANALADVAKNSADRAKSEEVINDKLKRESDPKKKKELEESLGKQKALNAKQELSDNIKVISATKSLFKEKTAAYKILDGMEKAMHTYKMLMMAKEVAMDLWKTGQEVINSMTRMAVTETEAAASGTAAVVNQGKGDPYTAFARMAAMAVLVASILGSGSAKRVGGFVPTAEQKQETQGTAMGYDELGNKIQVRRGVFGDTSAKSESIANSLSILKENSVDGLSYYNQMVELLTSIDQGIGNAAKSLYGVQGIRAGSMFNTVEGKQGGGFLRGSRSTTISDAGLIIEGTFAQLASDTNKAVVDFFEQVTITKKNWYGKAKTWTETRRKEIDDTTSQFFQGVFGDATKLFKTVGEKAGVASEQIDTILGGLRLDDYFVSLRGLKGADFEKELSAVIGSILDDASLAIFSSFEKFAKFGEGMTETVVRVIDANDKVRQQLKNIIGKDIEDTLNLQGVVPAYKEVIKYTTKDLTTATREELAAANKLLRGQGDTYQTGAFDVIETVFKSQQQLIQELGTLSAEDIQKLYESGSTLATKVVTTVTDGLTTSFDKADIKDASYQITEALVTLAGGLSNFLDQSNFFRENFMTEAERLVPVQTAVTEEMARLGYAGVDTREEFKALVTSLDLTTESGRIIYQALMDVADGFNTVASASEQTQSNLRSMQMRILELTGTDAEILAGRRAAELEATDPALRATQEYIYALEDVKTAQTNLANARKAEADSLKNTINTLRGYVDSLRKFKESLLLGSSSTLTPEQKYLQSKTAFETLLATATGAASTPEQIRAKNSAIEQLQGASSAFLDASRIYNASSAQYTSDFNYVQTALTRTADALDSQATDAEKQLTALGTLNESVLSVADAIKLLAAAQDKANALKPASDAAAETITSTTTTPVTVDYGQQAISTGSAIINSGTIYGAQGTSISVTEGAQKIMDTVREIAAKGNPVDLVTGLYNTLTKEWKLNSAQVSQILGLSRDVVLDYFKQFGLPAFARGTNYVPSDMLAQIHQGERIIPAADNAKLMQGLSDRNETNRVLVEEIRNLRQEVKQLRDQQSKETGDIIMANLDAQHKNAEHIGEAINATAQESLNRARVRDAVKLR